MADEADLHGHLPFCYTDLFKFGHEGVSEVNSRLVTFADWRQSGEGDVSHCLRDGRGRGVLLWQVWNQVEAARKLGAQPEPLTVQVDEPPRPTPAANAAGC